MKPNNAGTPLEISKRRFVVPILYAQSIVWTGQIFFMCKLPLRRNQMTHVHSTSLRTAAT